MNGRTSTTVWYVCGAGMVPLELCANLRLHVMHACDGAALR
jgi:hypothetical protein